MKKFTKGCLGNRGITLCSYSYNYIAVATIPMQFSLLHLIPIGA